MAWYNPHIDNEDYWKNLEEGSLEWTDYFREQIDRCLYGYVPPEKPHIFIEGRYYFVLNFCKAQTDKGWVNPEYRDYQNEYFEFFEDNDAQGINTGMKKARRKGFSLLSLMGIIYYDMVFYTGIIDGIAVGDDETLTTLRAMLWSHIAEVDSFFALQSLVWNKDRVEFGWEEENDKGRKVKHGTGNQLRMELFSKNTELFKGTIMRHVLFEEIGKFQKLRMTYNGTKDCFMDGTRQVGTGIFGGTGGDVEKGSQDFMYMSMHPEAFNMKWMFVPATKGAKPFIDAEGNSLIDNVTLKAAKEASEIYNVPVSEILIGADAWWKREEEKFKRLPDKTELYSFYQERPTKPAHIFLTKGSGIFNQVFIENRETYLNERPLYEGATTGYFKLVKNWRLLYNINDEWTPQCVEFVPHPDGPCIVWRYPNHADTDLFGLDPYGQEESVTSDSIGVLYGFRLKTSITQDDGHKIIFKYSGRPENIKDFHGQTLSALIWYDAKVDAESNMAAEFFSYMETMKATKYLKLAPKAYDEFETKAKNKYGRRMSPPVKKIMVKDISEYINEYCDEIDDPSLLNDLKFFGSMNTDHAFAFGHCLMYANEKYSIDGAMMTAEVEDQPETSLIKYKRVNGQIVAIVPR